jgi:hypothetical protein
MYSSEADSAQREAEHTKVRRSVVLRDNILAILSESVTPG